MTYQVTIKRDHAAAILEDLVKMDAVVVESEGEADADSAWETSLRREIARRKIEAAAHPETLHPWSEVMARTESKLRAGL